MWLKGALPWQFLLVFLEGERFIYGFIFMKLHDRVMESVPFESQLSCMMGKAVGSVPWCVERPRLCVNVIAQFTHSPGVISENP